MKLRIFSVLAALAMAVAFSFSAEAQYMTQDVVFVKVGYIPTYTISFNDYMGQKVDDAEFKGVAIQGEYNLNFNGFWLGFGMEYQYDRLDVKDEKNKTYQFIMPMASLKVAAVGGLYVGAGVSGKYLIAAESDSDGTKYDKKIDLWANGILGYHVPIGEGIFFDLEGRFGWNLTNKQFSSGKDGSTGATMTLDPKNAYDIAFYAGIGFRAIGSNY
jgi:hypothetical protein